MSRIFSSMFLRMTSGLIYSAKHKSTKDSNANFIGKNMLRFIQTPSICFNTVTKSELGLKIKYYK